MTGSDDIELIRLRRRLERERKARLEAEIIAERATARLFELDRLKSMFVSNVSHELRTPLTSVLGFTELLCTRWDGLPDAQKREFLGLTRQNALALQHLIERLLDFSRTRDDQVDVAPVRGDVAAQVGEVIERIRPTITSHRVLVDCLEPVVAHADETALRRIVTNLVDNAVKYSPEGSTISVAVRAVDGSAVLEVGNEGSGIPAAERARIFDRFYRGEDNVTLRTRGLGIGLAVVKNLTEAMGGTVSVECPATGGTVFRVALPATAP